VYISGYAVTRVSNSRCEERKGPQLNIENIYIREFLRFFEASSRPTQTEFCSGRGYFATNSTSGIRPNLPPEMSLLGNISQAIAELRLGDKLLPWRNASIAWFWIWLPAFGAYMYLLMGYINAKPYIGTIEVLDGVAMKALFYTDSAKQLRNSIEVIATQSRWSEGPLWMHDESASLNYLLYSDTILNKIYRWEEGRGFFTVGKTIHLHSSGCKSNATHCSAMYEAGSNGLIRVHPRLLPASASASHDLLAAQHGERAIALLRENGTRSFIATHYQGRRFNSPNDMVYSPEGHLYFTDPPYGIMDAVHRRIVPDLQELNFSGVFMISAGDLQGAIESGQPTPNVRLLHDGLSRPNGLAFSPDFSKLYVSNSDRGQGQAVIKVFDVSSSGALLNGKTFYDASAFFSCAASKKTMENDTSVDVDVKVQVQVEGEGGGQQCEADESVGVPDGLKVDIHGNVLSSGPGGVLVLSPAGTLLGRLLLPGTKVSNVAFGCDGRLYVTATDKVVRLRVRTKSAPRGEQLPRR